MRLPSASLPDRTPDRPIPQSRPDQFLAGPDTYTVPPGGIPLPPFFPGYGYAPYMVVPSDARDMRRELSNGYLYIDVRPATAQVFVDGFYMGTVDEFRRLIPGRQVEAGPHEIELRAPGYQPATFDVRLRPNETITYRTDLEPAAAQMARPSLAPPAAPKTFYVIPGCYAGDKPPRTVRLPRGCDRSKVRTIPPEVRLIARVQR